VPLDDEAGLIGERLVAREHQGHCEERVYEPKRQHDSNNEPKRPTSHRGPPIRCAGCSPAAACRGLSTVIDRAMQHYALVHPAELPILRDMAHKQAARPSREPTTGRRLYRESVYLHQDEMEAVEEYARKQRCSKAEVLRRTVRAFFKIED